MVRMFYTDDPVRDAADYYDWLDEHGATWDELEKEIFSGYGRSEETDE